MKKRFFVGLAMASAIVYSASASAATNGCAGNGQPKDITVATDLTTAFVRVPFSAKCSANVLSEYAETATAFGVVAGSQKGKNYFGGGTTGGSVKGMGQCAATGCTTSEVSATNAALARDAGS